MRKWIVLLALPLAAADPVDLPAELTLDQALAIAFKSSTVLRRAAAQVDQARAQAVQAKSPLLPQLGLQVADTGQTVNTRALGLDTPFIPARVGPFQVVDARVNLTQNLVNFQAWDREKAAKRQATASVEQAANTREVLALQVSTAFAQAVRAQSSVRTLEKQVGLARQLHKITQDRLDAGVASRLEASRSLQQVANLEQTLEEVRNNYVAAKLQLANLLNARITADYRLSEEAQQAPDGAQDAIAKALEARPDYRAASERVKAADYQLQAARRQRWPVVQFRADYGQSGRSPIDNLNTFRLQGAISMPVYTGGRIEGEIAEAQGRLAESRAAVDEIRSQVETEVRTAVAALEAARKQLEIAQGNVKLAGEELDLATARFQSGVADNTEVVNAQDRVSRAEDNVVRAGFNRDLAAAQLRRALGIGGK